MNQLHEVLIALISAGAGIIGKILFDKRKHRAEAMTIEAEIDIKEYDSWKKAYADMSSHYHQLNHQIVELHRKYTELQLQQANSELLIRELKKENKALKERIAEFTNP